MTSIVVALFWICNFATLIDTGLTFLFQPLSPSSIDLSIFSTPTTRALQHTIWKTSSSVRLVALNDVVDINIGEGDSDDDDRPHSPILDYKNNNNMTISSTLTTSTHQKQIPQLQRNRTRFRIPIVEYNDDWICINKPAGMTVHRSRTTPKREKVVTSALKRQLGRKVYPVHRLDHRTSGAMLLAFDSNTCSILHSGLRTKSTETSTSTTSIGTEDDEDFVNDDEIEDMGSNSTQKQYIAIVRGVLQVPSTHNHEDDADHGPTSIPTSTTTTFVVDDPIRVNDIYKSAATKVTILATTEDYEDIMKEHNSNRQNAKEDGFDEGYDYRRCSIVLCEPITGRTHQLRKHLRNLGHPIIGDTKYGDTKVNRYWRLNYKLDRLALHCFKLKIPIPKAFTVHNEVDGTGGGGDPSVEDDEVVYHTVIAPLSSEFQNVFAKINDSNSSWLRSLWETAVSKEPHLSLPFTDVRDGSLGRNYRRQRKVQDEYRNK